LQQDLTEQTLRTLASAIRPRGVKTDNRTAKIARVRRLLIAIHERRHEGPALFRFPPTVLPFHRSQAKWRVLDGSNQSMKTTTAAAEVALAFCGRNPKYRPKSGKAIILGLDEDHLADPMAVKMLQPGAFKIIQDEITGKWRSVRADPNDPTKLDPYDAAYREKWKDGPPLIPPRFIKSIAWEDRAKGVPRIIEGITEWEMQFRSSRGKPLQGKVFDLPWIDEHIEQDQWFYEIVRGMMALADGQRTPRGIWSATPQNVNLPLLELRRRADAGDPNVFALKVLLADNPFLLDEEKEEFEKTIPEGERPVRILGHYYIVGRQFYSTFDPMGPHGCDPFAVPANWTVFVSVDPGVQRCGTVILAVDPEEKHIWILSAFRVKKRDSITWAEEVKRRLPKQKVEAFIIDHRAGRCTRAGGVPDEDTIASKYWEGVEALGIVPRISGPLDGFFPGSDQVEAREMAVTDALRPRADGPFLNTPLLRAFRGETTELDREMQNANYPKVGKRTRVVDDIVVALEYGVAFKPYYQEPEEARQTPENPTERRWHQKQERRKRRRQAELQQI
jgi:hypothetical protein